MLATHNNLGTADLKNISDMVSSYVGNNKIAVSDLPKTLEHIVSVYSDIKQNVSGVTSANDEKPVEPVQETQEQKYVPAVPVKQSIRKNYLVSLLDGGHYVSLRKHLKSKYNMTPEQYREAFNLPDDYPMVAPNYSKLRSELARRSGLGTTRHQRAGRNSAIKKAATTRAKTTTARRSASKTK